jgi:hypothetical protein
MEVWSLRRAAETLGVSQRGARYLVYQGRLPATKLGHELAVFSSDVADLLARRGGPGRGKGGRRPKEASTVSAA